MNFNKVFLLGRLTRDPQLRTTSGGQNVVTLGLATNRVWVDKNNAKQEATEFHDVVVWGRQAELVQQFLTKGSLIFVEGRMQTRTWVDKAGQNRKTTEVVSERIQFGPRRNDGSGGNFNKSTPPPNSNLSTIDISEGGEEIKPEDIGF